MDSSKLVTCDVENYPNYFLVMFRKVSTGETLYFEKFNNSPLDIRGLLYILNKYTIITFNGEKFDKPVIEAAIAGFSNNNIHKITRMIIDERRQPWEVRKQAGIPAVQMDMIDIINVAPLVASLKIYGGRIHCPKMQDLPIPPNSIIKASELPLMRKYCGNDLHLTELLFLKLKKEIELRIVMSEDYGTDLRSKSDAQIAEAVIKKELDHKYDIKARKPKVPEGTKFLYKPPTSLSFATDTMKDVLEAFTTNPFRVKDTGHVEMPEAIKKMKFEFYGTKYKMGVGGIHSCEKKARHVATKQIIVRDYDVAAFYPNIILINGYAPRHLGKAFLKVYGGIVERRLAAKAAKIYATDMSLKIVINGSFGKLGSKYSALYSPDLMMQVTVTGQLSLMMLVERFEMAGISVVSANTDGIVTLIPVEKESLAADVITDWELDTGYEMEGTDYLSINNRDVNNYIAIKADGSKGKGILADRTDHYYILRKNPVNEICTEAIDKFLQHGTPIADTIKGCRDITRFVTVRTVKGGAVQWGVLLGSAIRWYYGKHELSAIHYAKNGNKVPKSDGAVPLMDLPSEFPSDVDFGRYIAEAETMLKSVGYK